MAREFISYHDAEGTDWGVEVQLPGSSNAMIVFHHPGGRSARLDRYAWFLWSGPEARSVTSHVAAEKIFSALTSEKLALLFRRSMPVSTAIPVLDTAI